MRKTKKLYFLKVPKLNMFSLNIYMFHSQIQPPMDQKYLFKNSRNFLKVKLGFAAYWHYLHIIYIVFTAIHIAFYYIWHKQSRDELK